jgi:glycerophosphoryl diester phosphodiesterase
LAPENTLAAFRRALESAVDGIELDVHLSRDGHPVVLHDRLLDRTTDGNGPVDEMDLAQIQALDAGSHLAVGFRGERVPTLAEVLDLPSGTVEIQVELKGLTPGLAGKVVALLRERQLADRTIVTSFVHTLLRDVHEVAPEFRMGALFAPNPRLPGDPGLRADELTGMARAARADIVLANHGDLNDATVSAIRERGCEVGAWTVNEPADLRRLFQSGVERLTTDSPDVALELREPNQTPAKGEPDGP